MTYRLLITTALISSFSVPAMAQSLNGASIEGELRKYYDDDLDDTSLSFEAGGELALGGGFVLGANLGATQATFFSEDQDDVLTSTVHAMYMLTPTTAVGLYASQDTSDRFDSTNYGIEAGARSANSRFEIYYGDTDPQGDASDADVTTFGLSFEFNVGQGFSVGFDYEAFTLVDGAALPTGGVEDLTINDRALVARYSFDNGPSIYAEIGEISASASDGDTFFVSVNELEYFGIGAEYAFGPKGGNIFGGRTLTGFGG